MRKAIYVLILFFLYSFSGYSQLKNRAYLGLYGYYSFPLFELAHKNYKPGPGFSISYLSKRMPVLEDKNLSIRLGGSFGISSQGQRTFTIRPGDSVNVQQNFYSNYLFLNLLGRLTFEKNKTLKPYTEFFCGLGSFTSETSYRPYISTGPRADLKTNSFILGLSAGYILRITDGFLIDGKITFTQGTSKVLFTDFDNFTYSNPFYQQTVCKALPSLVTVQLGILVRLPTPSMGYPGSSSSSPSQPGSTSSSTQPTETRPSPDKRSESSPRENRPNEGPRRKH